jgi:hypothetical protein
MRFVDKVRDNGVKSLLQFMECITHIRNLMRNEGKLDEFKKLFLTFDEHGDNMYGRLMNLKIHILDTEQFGTEIIEFMIDMQVRENFHRGNSEIKKS